MYQEDNRKDDPFPSTRWTLIERIKNGETTINRKALGQLVKRYESALRAHLVSTKRIDPDRAEDLLQSFIKKKLLVGNLAKQADQARGQFRKFLVVSLNHYVVDYQRAMKRGHDGHCTSVDPRSLAEHAVSDDGGCSDAYDVAWAREVLSEATRRMKVACETSDRLKVWLVFERRVLKPTLEGTETPPYSDVVADLDFSSPSKASNALETAKRMYRRHLREVVYEYAGSDASVDEEIRELRRILAQIGARSG